MDVEVAVALVEEANAADLKLQAQRPPMNRDAVRLEKKALVLDLTFLKCLVLVALAVPEDQDSEDQDSVDQVGLAVPEDSAAFQMKEALILIHWSVWIMPGCRSAANFWQVQR